MVKNLLFVGFVLALGIQSTAQSKTGWGAKGGLNYGSTGNISNSLSQSAENPNSNLGWHFAEYSIKEK